MLTKVLFRFARNIRKKPNEQIERQIKQFQQQNVKMPQQLSINKKQEIVEDIDNDDDFEPLSYDKKVQEKIRQQFSKQLSFQGQDPSPQKLVHRPSKGAAWGLGGQLMVASKKVELQGLKDDADEIIEFLQLQQVKNIYLHDFHAQDPTKPKTNRRRYHILGSCYAAKHCWRVGIELKNAFNLNSAKTKLKRRKYYDPIFATMNGGKHEEWMMVEYKDYQISLMTQEQRQAADLQWKWNNQIPDSAVQKHVKMKLTARKNMMFQKLDD